MLKTILEYEDYTVASDYKKLDINRTNYQSENELEMSFINQLVNNNSYEYLKINNEKELLNNLKIQIERLNKCLFNENEWNRFLTEFITNKTLGILEKTKIIQTDYIKEFTFDNGLKQNIKLIDKSSYFNNKFQVINQYEQTGKYKNRYDVTILINGLPLVHIELKRRGVALKEAFNQIERYQRDSFFSNSGLFEFVQIFIISNGTYTKYYSNTTRLIQTTNEQSKRKLKSNSYLFTSFWTDGKNKPIYSLEDFTNTFLLKRNLFNIITKYSVLTIDNDLLVMRPYQIMASEKILERINIANNYKYYGSIKAGGYIWHTTGSGKTLTSFKTAQLCQNLDYIDKVIFVVDRKDLDYQTVKEFEKFERGSVSSNSSTNVLKRQLEDDNKKIICTTIQKLNRFVKGNKTHSVYNKKVVMIFDECHRSQFGESHKNITLAFKKYFIFGFTGTPIFLTNAGGTKLDKAVKDITTDKVFGDALHTYTILDAIRDGNVLPFLVETVKTLDKKEDIKDEKVYSINEREALLSNKRIESICDYIISEFDRKTKNKKFNSILACDSIEMARKYYSCFKEKEHDLKVGIIYSYGANEDIEGFFTDDENNENTDLLDESSRDFLENAIRDYNINYGTNYDTSSDSFNNYYKDLSLRMKNKEMDLLIVVNMFLTGFDAKRLNTLWVDKNLKYHGLLQSFSRTNRIYNNLKSNGNIVCFRNLEQNINDALELFGADKEKGMIILESYDAYLNGYTDKGGIYHEGYFDLSRGFKEAFRANEIPEKLEDKKIFVKSFNNILKIMNVLSTFKQFDLDKNNGLNEYEFQDYMSTYNEIRNELKEKYDNNERENVGVLEDITFEVELIKEFEVNIDYILIQLEKYIESGNAKLLVEIDKTISSCNNLKSKKELINDFINKINNKKVCDVVIDFTKLCKEKALKDLENLINVYKLKENTIDVMNKMFNQGEFTLNHREIADKIAPTMSIRVRKEKIEEIEFKLKEYFNNYVDVVNSLY